MPDPCQIQRSAAVNRGRPRGPHARTGGPGVLTGRAGQMHQRSPPSLQSRCRRFETVRAHQHDCQILWTGGKAAAGAVFGQTEGVSGWDQAARGPLEPVSVAVSFEVRSAGVRDSAGLSTSLVSCGNACLVDVSGRPRNKIRQLVIRRSRVRSRRRRQRPQVDRRRPGVSSCSGIARHSAGPLRLPAGAAEPSSSTCLRPGALLARLAIFRAVCGSSEGAHDDR